MLSVTVLSGGLDSTTLAYQLYKNEYEQLFLSFNYGQKHSKELEKAAITAKKLKGEHHIISLPFGDLLTSAVTTKDRKVPEGHYAAENMSQTVVPNRNAIMLSIAWGVACSRQARVVSCGIHAGDFAVYPDCRQYFIDKLNSALLAATEGLYPKHSMLHINTPYVNISKAAILKLGLGWNVPYEDTWTCYVGGEKACGTCGACVERLSSFALNNAEDPLEYEDRETWKEYMKEHEGV
jgi:7-cyano-7-deazaguanine synthase